VYLRFTVLQRDEESRSPKGLFTATYDLRNNGDLNRDELIQVQAILDWFGEHLKAPCCLGKPGTHRAVCWFQPEATKAVRKMWDLAGFLQSRGLYVNLNKTKDPGTIIYQDQQQVVAFPRRKGRR
jgi:hypothetical protein